MRTTPLALLILAGCVTAGREVVDLTHPLDPSIPLFPGGTPPETAPVATPERDGYAAGRLAIDEHTGTHIDAPAHFVRTAWTLERIPASRLVVPAVVLDIRDACRADPAYRASVADLLRWERRFGRLPVGCALLVLTGWGSRWDDPTMYLNRAADGTLNFPGLSEELARFLADERAIVAVGIDTLSIDHGPSRDFAAHKILLRANVYAIENLANLERLPAKGATLMVAPLPLRGGSGSPARVLAWVPR